MSKISELHHLFRALKAPAAARALPKLAERAREESWSHERFLEAVLSTEIASRDSHGGESRIKAARFPARKTLEEFDFTFQHSVKKQVVEHLGQLDFLHARENVVLLGPPGTGKSHLAIAISTRACLAGQRVAFATATEWVARLSEAKRQGSLQSELRRLGFIPLVVVDEVGYIPFDPEAANLMFSLISARYERASVIVTSNKPFSAWGEIFGDEVVAAAMIDRLVHHAEILALKGDSYRLRDKDLGSPTPHDRPSPLGLRFAEPTGEGGVTFQPAKGGDFSTGLDIARSSHDQCLAIDGRRIRRRLRGAPCESCSRVSLSRGLGRTARVDDCGPGTRAHSKDHGGTTSPPRHPRDRRNAPESGAFRHSPVMGDTGLEPRPGPVLRSRTACERP
jgi:DNA replication protein DnaC